jgi:hypothetical protein
MGLKPNTSFTPTFGGGWEQHHCCLQVATRFHKGKKQAQTAKPTILNHRTLCLKEVGGGWVN